MFFTGFGLLSLVLGMDTSFPVLTISGGLWSG